jgi:hypothetical protein
MKNKEENHRVHHRWQAPENKLDISLPSGEQIQEIEDLSKSKVYEIEHWRSQRYMKSKTGEVKDI